MGYMIQNPMAFRYTLNGVSLGTTGTVEDFESLVLSKMQQINNDANALVTAVSTSLVAQHIAPTYIDSTKSLVSNVLNAMNKTIPNLITRMKNGELNKKDDIIHLLKTYRDAIKYQYESMKSDWDDTGAAGRLLVLIATGLSEATDQVTNFVVEKGAKAVQKIGEEFGKQLKESPVSTLLGVAVVVGLGIVVIKIL